MGILAALYFFEAHYQKRAQLFLWECDFHRNYGMVVTLLSFLCNYDNLTLKLYQKKCSYLDERWFLLTDSKLEVCQEWVLILKHLRKYQNQSWAWCKAIDKVIYLLLIVLFINNAAWWIGKSSGKFINFTLELFILKKTLGITWIHLTIF